MPAFVCRDDNGRTALHWAAQLDFEPGSRTLLTAAAAKRTQVQAEQEARAAEAAAAAAAAAAAGGDGVAPAPAAPAEEDGNVPPPLEVFQDKHGCTALHLAARQGHTAASRLLLEAAASGDGAPALARTKNKAGQTALHLAALAGSAPCAALLAAAAPQAAAARTKLALTAADLAERRRHAALAAALRAADPAAALAALPPTEQDQPRTLLVAPPECLCHYTCPAPITRQVGWSCGGAAAPCLLRVLALCGASPHAFLHRCWQCPASPCRLPPVSAGLLQRRPPPKTWSASQC